jgi:hypothetical protein
MNNELLKSNIRTNQLIKLLRNSKFHIELYSKLFIVIKHGLFIEQRLKNEIIKLNVNFFL